MKLLCPVAGCSYWTFVSSPFGDVRAHAALLAHLQRKRHAYSRQEAKAAARVAKVEGKNVDEAVKVQQERRA